MIEIPLEWILNLDDVDESITDRYDAFLALHLEQGKLRAEMDANAAKLSSLRDILLSKISLHYSEDEVNDAKSKVMGHHTLLCIKVGLTQLENPIMIAANVTSDWLCDFWKKNHERYLPLKRYETEQGVVEELWDRTIN